ncbi:MAG: hypothetical protein IH860_09895 [Chloroflexi bacterium]|nr:hypothetical protein [Chloroflexota bacterium]
MAILTGAAFIGIFAATFLLAPEAEAGLVEEPVQRPAGGALVLLGPPPEEVAEEEATGEEESPEEGEAKAPEAVDEVEEQTLVAEEVEDEEKPAAES